MMEVASTTAKQSLLLGKNERKECIHVEHAPSTKLRSTGWTPLAYPSASLFESAAFEFVSSTPKRHGKQNRGLSPYFPLHKDVILAAARELLILDGTIDGKTLESVIPVEKKDSSKEHKAKMHPENIAPYLRHLVPNIGHREEADEDDMLREQNYTENRKQSKRRCEESVHNLPLSKRRKGVCSNRNRATDNQNEKTDSRTTALSIKISSKEKLIVGSKSNEFDAPGVIRKPRCVSISTADATIEASTTLSADQVCSAGFGTGPCPMKVESTVSSLKCNVENKSIIMIEEDSSDEESARRNKFPTAELIADAILNRSIIKNANEEIISFRNKDVSKPTFLDSVEERPPRKVSDVDSRHPVFASSSVSSWPNLSVSESLSKVLKHSLKGASSCDSNDPALSRFKTESEDGRGDLRNFLDLSARTAEGAFQLLRSDLPRLLEVSIRTESHLRDLAHEMTRRMTQSFDDRPLRLFLGYKSSAMKRQRLIEVLSDYLFDVSHAMFAWQQTEHEILVEQAATMSDLLSGVVSSLNKEKLEAKVRDALFDDRALKKIGGFDNSSVLPHALSIRRLRVRGTSWKEFATTAIGRRMLRHHRDGNLATIGCRRRGQRSRRRNPCSSHGSSDDEKRPRSSSVTSDESENTREAPTVHCRKEKESVTTTLSLPVDGMIRTELKDDSSTKSSLVSDDVVSVSLSKEDGKSWGVTLAREGDMCLVMRASEVKNVRSAEVLQCGDMVISVRNERQETVAAPSTCIRYNDNPNDKSSGWFREIVNMFKTSNALQLKVRRVQRI